jgi:hypothetical protein
MSRHCHPNVHLIEPYQQGGLDSLCGLYALINAARILYANGNPVTGQRCKRLFAEGIDFLTAKQGSRNAAHRGMTVAEQRKLAKALLKSETLAGHPSLHLGPRTKRIGKVGELEMAITSALEGGAVLLVCFHGRISHHSVIIGHTPARVLLFDSSGMTFVNKRSLRFSDAQGGSLTLHALTKLMTFSSG